MNRQEAYKFLAEYVDRNYDPDCDYDEFCRAMECINRLVPPTPDPDTGLMKCGCGGKAETHELYDNFSGTYMTDCKKCATGTTQYNTKKEAQDAWNTAMGLPEVDDD